MVLCVIGHWVYKNYVCCGGRGVIIFQSPHQIKSQAYPRYFFKNFSKFGRSFRISRKRKQMEGATHILPRARHHKSSAFQEEQTPSKLTKEEEFLLYLYMLTSKILWIFKLLIMLEETKELFLSVFGQEELDRVCYYTTVTYQDYPDEFVDVDEEGNFFTESYDSYLLRCLLTRLNKPKIEKKKIQECEIYDDLPF